MVVFCYDVMMRCYMYCGFGYVPPGLLHDDVRLLSASALHSGFRPVLFFFSPWSNQSFQTLSERDGSMMPSPF